MTEDPWTALLAAARRVAETYRLGTDRTGRDVRSEQTELWLCVEAVEKHVENQGGIIPENYSSAVTPASAACKETP